MQDARQDGISELEDPSLIIWEDKNPARVTLEAEDSGAESSEDESTASDGLPASLPLEPGLQNPIMDC